MELKDVIAKSPCVSKNITIKEFLDIAAKCKSDFFPVVENGVVVGIVSEKDLIKLIKIQPVASIQPIISSDISKTLLQRKVADIMTSNPITVKSSSKVEFVIKVMVANNLRRVVVVDDGRKLVGIVHVRDIIRKL